MRPDSEQIYKSIQSFREEVRQEHPLFATRRRKVYLNDRLTVINQRINEIIEWLDDLQEPEWFKDFAHSELDLPRLVQEKKRILAELENPHLTKISPSDITRAKSFPVQQLKIFAKPPVKTGPRFKALCPLHEEQTPSFVIYPKSNSWYCFGCAQGGDNLNLLMQVTDLDFIQAVRSLL